MIFVDTSFWVALVAARDGHHEEARELLQRHGNERLLTTNHVRGEAWTFIRRRHGHRSAVSLLDAMQHSSRASLVFVTPEWEDEALRWLRRRDEQEYSFVDATSFVVMRSSRVRQALTFDHDFTVAGFEVVGL